jgi:uncharacterized protein (DUF952 family)
VAVFFKALHGWRIGLRSEAMMGTQDVIFHIAQMVDWEHATDESPYAPASLEREGFIHCSTRGQVVAVANRLFAGRQDLVMLRIDPARVPHPIRFENCEGGQEQFPHIYGALPVAAVSGVFPFRPGRDGQFLLPDFA